MAFRSAVYCSKVSGVQEAGARLTTQPSDAESTNETIVANDLYTKVVLNPGCKSTPKETRQLLYQPSSSHAEWPSHGTHKSPTRTRSCQKPLASSVS